MSLYSAAALAERAGITYRQVSYWTEQGYLKPEHIEGIQESGSGNRRVYSQTQVDKARLMAALGELRLVARLADALVRDTQIQVEGRLLGWVKRS